jgi:hypothetical protein
LGEPFGTAPKRQNTSRSVSPAGQVTIIDPTHPLYGRMLPLLRSPSTRSKAQLLVQLPDGRVQRLPREVTNLEASASVPHSPALIAIPTLLPLAHLICAMLAGKEDVCYDTTQSLTPPVANCPPSAPPDGASGIPDLVEWPGRKRSATTGPLSLRSHPADAGAPMRRRQGEQR